jgi:hypothetical protein
MLRSVAMRSDLVGDVEQDDMFERVRMAVRSAVKSDLIGDVEQDDMLERVKMAVDSAVAIQTANSEVHECRMVITKADRETRRRALAAADIDITDAALHQTHTDEQDWAERVGVINVVLQIFGMLIENDFRRNIVARDLFAAVYVPCEQLDHGLIYGRDPKWIPPKDPIKLHLETNESTITVREAYESYRTIIWSAKQCYELAHVVPLLTPTEPESSWVPVMGAFADLVSTIGIPDDRRTVESLMMIAILILREEMKMFESEATVDVRDGICWPPLPNGAAILHVCKGYLLGVKLISSYEEVGLQESKRSYHFS